MSSSLSIAAAAYPLDPVASLAAWRDKAARWVAEGAATGARLLVFPEYGLIEIAHAAGATVAADLAATLAAVAERYDAAEATYADLARRHDVHILTPSGPRARGDGRFVNTASLVTPAGRIGRQDKQIMTPFEHDWGIVAGAPAQVFATVLGRIGVAICYDSEFPLLVRAQTVAGAELLLIPACTERRSGHMRVRIAAQARALESTIAAVLSPTVGEAVWSPAVDHNSGAAGIFVPPEHQLSMTGVIGEGGLDRPGWVAGTIDLAALRRLRTIGEMRNDADWRHQPGGATVAAATVMDLT